MNRLLCLSAMLGCTSWASAQALDAVSEKDFLGDMPIVLSVSRLPQRLDETPGAVTILDRDMIRLSGARDVADLLRLVPGFQTSTSFETVAPLASYHGGFDGYSNRMQVLVDGRSVYSPFFIGSVGPGLQTVAMADIERIEVLRGSNSAAYGARAFLGVINIVTRHTVDTLGQQASVAGGENGVQDVQASLGWGQDDASFRLGVDRRADAGLSGSNGHNRVDRVNFRADLRTSSNDEVQLRAGGFTINTGKGFLGNIDNPQRESVFDSAYVQLDGRRSLGADEDLALNFSHSEETYQDSFPYSLIPRGINDSINIEGGGRSSNDTVSLQHTFRYGPAVRMVWGGEFRREQVTSRPLYNTDSTFITDFTRLFGNAEWRLARDWVLNAGAMVEHSSVSGDSLAPRLMMNWHAAEGQTWRAGISKAHRPPSTFEKYSNIIYKWNDIPLGNLIRASGNVEPETVVTHEVGYLGEFPRWGLNLDVRVFQEQIGGFIRQQNATSPRDYANSEDFAIQGAEYQLKWRPWRDAQFIFNQSYTEIGSDNRVTATASKWAAPMLSSSLTYFQKLPGGLDLSLMHQDSGTSSLQGSGLTNLLAMTRTDLRLGLPLRWGRNRGEIALVVQNLGASYADFHQDFQFERRAFVTLRVEN